MHAITPVRAQAPTPHVVGVGSIPSSTIPLPSLSTPSQTSAMTQPVTVVKSTDHAPYAQVAVSTDGVPKYPEAASQATTHWLPWSRPSQLTTIPGIAIGASQPAGRQPEAAGVHPSRVQVCVEAVGVPAYPAAQVTEQVSPYPVPLQSKTNPVADAGPQSARTQPVTVAKSTDHAP